MLFESVTEWAASPFLVVVHVGYFDTRELAAAFSQKAARLVRRADEMVLLGAAGEELARVGEDFVDVYRRAPEPPADAVETDRPGYETCRIAVSAFDAYPELASSFGALSVGVGEFEESI